MPQDILGKKTFKTSEILYPSTKVTGKGVMVCEKV